MSGLNPVIVRINEQNRARAAEQAILMEKWLKDPVLLQAAIEAVRREHDRFVPVYNQLPFEAHLAVAADLQVHVLKSRAKRAGSAQKTDTLQELIEKLVGRNPGLSEHDLRARLNRDTYPEVIADLNEDSICFIDGKGALKEARLSGLKDRLSRAKKKVKSRKRDSAKSSATVPVSAPNRGAATRESMHVDAPQSSFVGRISGDRTSETKPG